MTYLTRRKKKGRYYLYLEKSARINGKPRRVWQKYLGPEDKIEDLALRALLRKHTEHLKITTLDFGISAALWQIADKIGLASLINRNSGKKRKQGLSVGDYITIAAINRCSRPVSKSKLGKWFKYDWLSAQYDIKPDVLNAQTYWNHFQYIDEKAIEKMEIAINKVVLEEFDLDMDSLFYDPTNFFTFSKGTGKDGLLQFGHSKENRNGNRLVNYTLLCARESGIPLMHKTYSGNVQDAKRFKSVPEEIYRRLEELNRDPKKVTLIFDKGNHSKEAFKAMDKQGFGFIASARNSTQKDLLHIPRTDMKKITLPITKKSVEYHKETRKIYKKNRTIYVIFDANKNKKQVHLFNEKLDKKVSTIREFFKSRLNVKKWRNLEAVKKKVESIIGRNPFKSVIEYSISGEEANLSLKISLNKKAKEVHEETLGRSLIFTNCHDWTPASVIWSYREQYIVEHAFKKMKSPTSICIRPMYHYRDKSIKIHVFICVLSLLLLALLRLTLSRKNLYMSYDEILDNLRISHVLKIQTSKNGKPYWKLDNNGTETKQIIKKLNLGALL